MMKSRQRGGTLLGLIFGLVAGLAVALVVAVYVTKVPVPFVHHQASRSPLQDEAEAERNRNWNPNAGLQSPVPDTSANPAGVASGTVSPPPSPTTGLVPAEVPAATPPASATSSATPPSTPLAGNLPAPNPSASTAASGKGVQSSPVRSAQAPSADPLGQLVASRTPAREPAHAGGGAASSDPFLYYVQAGAFRSSQDADAQRARLSLLGVEARVSERDQSGRRVYRVRVGPFQDHTSANQVQTQLASNGFDAALVREQR